MGEQRHSKLHGIVFGYQQWKASSTPSSFTSYKTSVFFAADDGRHGSELWISNGTKRGTALVADIQSGTGSSSPSDLLIQGKTLYMAADDGLHGRELWVHNIKNGQSSLIKDIRLGSKVGPIQVNDTVERWDCLCS